MSRALGIAIVIVTVLQTYVSAQVPPTCVAGFNWTFNSLDQSPCEMTLFLGEVCQPTFSIAPLQPGFVYLGPSIINVNSCRCSTVFYSLLSACALCQNQTFLSWSGYNPNCTTVYDSVFLDPIPTDTRIPHYAYLNVTVTDGFNSGLAQLAGDSPESTAVAATSTSASTSASTSTSTVKSSKSKAGPIAGGVIGGVVFLAIVVGLIIILLRRRKRSVQPPDLTYNPVASPDTSMSYRNSNYNPTIQTSMAKIYDPNDPSTFPTSDSGTHSPSQKQVTQNLTGGSYPLTSTNGSLAPLQYTGYTGHTGYTGAPEL